MQTQFPLRTAERLAAIEAWWTAFSDQETEINAMFVSGGDFDLVSFMRKYLDPVHPEIMWEFGPGEEKNHELALASEGNRDLIPLIRLMISRRPEFEFFEMRADRSHTPWEQYKDMQDGRISWDTAEGIQFTHSKDDHNLIDLVFYTTLKHQDDRTESNCFLLAETLLGEGVMRKWIGYVNVDPQTSKGLFSKFKTSKIPDHARPVSALRETIASEIASVKNALPGQPLFEFSENFDWSLLKMENNAQDDYARMDDLITMTVLEAGPHVSLYNGQPRFSSERFSAQGEDFIFVKMDRTLKGAKLESVADRGIIEDKLIAGLGPKALGGVIGGGTGHRYAYIFLAVTDLEASVPVICNQLREAKLPPACWVMFNDAEREQEWIGVWDDTPPPKLPVYEN